MLGNTQFLIFEIGIECNMGALHYKCPNLSEARFSSLNTSRLLNDETIIRSAVLAYRDFGFVGMIAWHYYCEPTLQGDRILNLQNRIRNEQPDARFFLLTNGTRKRWVDAHADEFDGTYTTDYSTDLHGHSLDNRRSLPRCEPNNHPCKRPYVECIFDAYGNHHPCCADWQGKASLGNIYVEGFDDIIYRWPEFQENPIANKWCQGCNSHFRYEPIQCVDDVSYKKIMEKSNEKGIS